MVLVIMQMNILRLGILQSLLPLAGGSCASVRVFGSVRTSAAAAAESPSLADSGG